MSRPVQYIGIDSARRLRAARRERWVDWIILGIVVMGCVVAVAAWGVVVLSLLF